MREVIRGASNSEIIHAAKKVVNAVGPGDMLVLAFWLKMPVPTPSQERLDRVSGVAEEVRKRLCITFREFAPALQFQMRLNGYKG
jgi:hypothetical protein